MFWNNWKTTAFGLSAIFTALAHLAGGVAAGDFSSVVPDIMAVLTGAGLVAGADAK